jgi:nitrogen regulatory protein P-II 1
MKKVEAIIRPFEVEAVKEALTAIAISRMTITEVKDFGGQRGQPEIYRGMRCDPPYNIEAKVEIIVPDEMARRAVEIFRETTEMGEPGREKVFVSSLEDIGPFIAEKKRITA